MSLFPHHDANPATIRGQATSAATKASAYTVLSGELFGRSADAASATDGYIEAPTASVTAPVEQSSGELSRASYLASGSLNRYAEAVDTYNAGIDDLNRRYEEQKAVDFNVGAEICTADGTIGTEAPDDAGAAIRQADQALQASLRGERDVLLESLDSEADAIAATLNAGPSDETIMLMIAAGYLPSSAAEAFPTIDLNTLNTIRSYFHEARKLWKTPGKFRKLFAMFSASKDLSEVAAELARTQHQWNAVLGAIGRNLDTTSLASLNTYMQSRQEISLLQYTKLFSQAEQSAATASWARAAAATGKVGGTLAILSVVANSVDLGDLIINGNDGKSDWDTALRATGDVTGLISSGGGLLALTPALSLGPVGAGILIGAGLVSCGIMIYRNWDQISAGVSTAVDWTGDRLQEGVDWAGDVVEDVGDLAADAGEAISDGWDAVTPW